jgi:hypothetical protein
MLSADQIANIEAAMEDEHRRDREALQRLKRFLPTNGNSNGKSVAERVRAAQAAPSLPLLGNGTDEDVEIGSIIGTVEKVMFENPTQRWTVPGMVGHLQQTGFPLEAQKPERTMGLIFRKLAKRGRIQIVRKGSGRRPNVYVAKEGGEPKK